VINYDMPDTMDAYTHRIGRTGRASRTGDAYNFVTIKDIAILAVLKRVLGSALNYEGADGAAGFLWADPAKTAKSVYSRNTVNTGKRSFSPRRGSFGKSRGGASRSLDGFPGMHRIAAASPRS